MKTLDMEQIAYSDSNRLKILLRYLQERNFLFFGWK